MRTYPLLKPLIHRPYIDQMLHVAEDSLDGSQLLELFRMLEGWMYFSIPPYPKFFSDDVMISCSTQHATVLFGIKSGILDIDGPA